MLKFWKDNNISWQAKGLLHYLLVQFDETGNINITMRSLNEASKNSKDSVRNIVNELVRNNYIIETWPEGSLNKIKTLNIGNIK